MAVPNRYPSIFLTGLEMVTEPTAAASGSASSTIPTNHVHGYYPTMFDWHTCTAVERDPDRAGGAWVFRGTRIPVAALFENLEDHASIRQFVDWFPGVTQEQVRAVLEYAAHSSAGVAPAADPQVKNGEIEVPPLKCNPREGWATDSKRLAQSGDDALVWPEFSNTNVSSPRL